MTPASLARLNRRIETAIPLARAADIRLEAGAQDTLTARAPFAANSNPHGSAFGGSLYVAALVAGYAQTVWLLDNARLQGSVVIRHAQADYRSPLHGDIAATVEPIDTGTYQRFLKGARRRGRGRIDLTIAVADATMTAFVLRARFAAVDVTASEAEAIE